MMGPINGPLVLCLLAISIKALAANADVSFTRPDAKFIPMIAFMCNKPAMHTTPNGWVSDSSTDCLNEPKKMLQYCQQLYPNLTITNFVEQHEITIKNWPDKKGREHAHRVQPYRCVVGDFESDALLVPQHCEFFHEHKNCGSYRYWGDIAKQRCRSKSMRIDDFSMLLSCGIDKFKGVEYVCCPKKERPIDKAVELKPVKPNKKVIKLDDETYDAYKAYLRGDERYLKMFGNEHGRFRAAIKAMEAHNHARITKMMKEWQEAREHVNTLKKTDAKAAEKLNTEILQRFQKLYNGYQQSDIAAKKELIALHLQHRQGYLNSKKRQELESYMEELQKKHVKPHRVLKHLEHYIRVEEKDRLQSLNHFTHLKKTDPVEAKRIQSQVGEHMKVIDERISQSLDMLHHFPSIETKLKPQLDKFRKQYDGLAKGAKDVVMRPIVIPQNKNIESNEAPKWTNQVVNDKIEKPKAAVHVVEDDSYDQETMEDEHQVFVAHHVDNKASFQQSSLGSNPRHISGSSAGIFGIAIGSVAVFVIIIVAIIMLRKRNNRHPVTHGFVEVDPAASPEERHVANMQMNGYENPTYKYFELNTNKN